MPSKLYHLIDSLDWNAALAWLRQMSQEKLLEETKSFSPLFLIVYVNDGALSPTAKELCFRLMDLGGKDLVLNIAGLGSVHKFHSNSSVLHLLCLSGYGYSHDVLSRLLLIGGKELVLMTDSEGSTALHCCFSYEDQASSLKVMDQLIGVGGTDLVLMANSNIETPLHLACNVMRAINPDVVTQLIQYGGKELVLMPDLYAQTVLHTSCFGLREGYNIDVVNLLIQVGGNELLFMKDQMGDTALHAACENCSDISPERQEIVFRLLDVGGETLLLMKNDCGRTAFEIECLSRTPNHQILDRFLEIGGDKLWNHAVNWR